MEFIIKSGSPEKQRSACVIVGVYEIRKLSFAGELLDRVSGGVISDVLRRGDINGKLGSHLMLAAWFARSLGAGREPAVTAMARMIAPRPLSAAALRYTRGVTLAWALFLAGNALVSTLLFAWAPTEVWSVHANLLTGPLMAGFFGLEMLVRRWALPPEERPSIKDVVRAWRAQHGQGGPSAASDHIT